MRKGILALLLSLACISCWPLSGETEKLEKALLAIPVGSFMKFTDLSPLAGRVICMVQPYQDRLAVLDPLAVQVNAYLADHAFALNESHFAFVFIGDDGFEVMELRRSPKLDSMAIHGASALSGKTLPDGFVARECVDGSDAAVAKFEFRGRLYIRLGQIR